MQLFILRFLLIAAEEQVRLEMKEQKSFNAFVDSQERAACKHD